MGQFSMEILTPTASVLGGTQKPPLSWSLRAKLTTERHADMASDFLNPAAVQIVDHKGMGMMGVVLRKMRMTHRQVRMVMVKDAGVLCRPDAQHRNQPQRPDVGQTRAATESPAPAPTPIHPASG